MDFDINSLPDAFSKQLLNGCFRVMQDRDNPVRLHFFAAGFRELFGHLLHSYAPDDEVRACSWFVQAPDTPTVTRMQRATYATQGGLTDTYVDGLGIDAKSLHKEAVTAIERMNRAAHVRPDTIVTDDTEIDAFVADALAVLTEFIESISMCREAVADALRDNVYSEMMTAFVERTFDNIDLVAGKGYEVDSFIDEHSITIDQIDAREVVVRFTGVAPVTLHYGKGDDAAAIQHDFPFWMTFRASVAKPEALEYDNSYVDDRSWYE